MVINPLSLRPYQDTGADVIADRGGSCILADEMGVGKTRTAIAAVAKLDAFPCVVVCPSQVKYVWSDEIAQVCPEARVEIVSGRKGTVSPNADFYIINRDILASRLSELLALRPRQMVIDEAHRCGGYGTAMLKAMWALSEAVRKAGGGVMPVTGTPITNDYTDLHRLFCLMAPKVFGHKGAFEAKYCPEKIFKDKIFGGMFRGKPRWMVAKEYAEARRNGLVPKASEEAVAELAKTVRRWSIRRTRASVWKVIPHTVNMWRVDLDDAEVMAADREARAAMKSGGVPTEGEFVHVRRLVAEAKIPLVNEWVRTFLEQTDEKLVVFVWHVEVRKAILGEFGTLAVAIAGTSEDKRKVERTFQIDPSVRVCVCNAGIEGVTLTAARTGLFAEMPWTDAALGQAKDRLNRIGQEASDIDYTVCIAAGTVEEIVWKIVNRKRDLVSKVMG